MPSKRSLNRYSDAGYRQPGSLSHFVGDFRGQVATTRLPRFALSTLRRISTRSRTDFDKE